ncbi:endoplasmic reticulum resident 27 [Labeo rohita]|uniref:Endoplasmic reticulum resident 27 n=1 Tax=Labeo rohita TaxID=84645 RepID=A0A498NL60_LABRO|nr:endoplasmic reticulum resident 27 [Labeo rohita]
MSRSYRTILCMNSVHVCDEGLLSFHQSEAARGYKEFLAAAKQIDKLPVALCSEKEVWAKYDIASDTISVFRKMLFVLVNGKEKSNARVLEYFGLKSSDLPRISIYDSDSDKKWLMPAGKITTERVQNFCDSFLDGELQTGQDGGRGDVTQVRLKPGFL